MSTALSTTEEINRLHAKVVRSSEASKTLLHAALVAAWKAGKLLTDEKKRVRHAMGAGAWLHWLEQNFQGSPRTAQKYMRLATMADSVEAFAELSLRQVYFRLGIATEPKTRGAAERLGQLPEHLSLANQLLLSLATLDEDSMASSPRSESIRSDLRILYERLRCLFEKRSQAHAAIGFTSFAAPATPQQNWLSPSRNAR